MDEVIRVPESELKEVLKIARRISKDATKANDNIIRNDADDIVKMCEKMLLRNCKK